MKAWQFDDAKDPDNDIEKILGITSATEHRNRFDYSGLIFFTDTQEYVLLANTFDEDFVMTARSV